MPRLDNRLDDKQRRHNCVHHTALHAISQWQQQHGGLPAVNLVVKFGI
jgi:hypothetical protein